MEQILGSLLWSIYGCRYINLVAEIYVSCFLDSEFLYKDVLKGLARGMLKLPYYCKGLFAQKLPKIFLGARRRPYQRPQMVFQDRFSQTLQTFPSSISNIRVAFLGELHRVRLSLQLLVRYHRSLGVRILVAYHHELESVLPPTGLDAWCFIVSSSRHRINFL